MATDRNTLKQWFIRGAKPLATQFAAWIDAFWHKDDKIPASNIEGLQEAMDEKANQQVLQAVADDLAAHKTDTTTHADIRDTIDAEASARASEDEGLHDDIEAEEARAEQAEAALVPKEKLTAVLTGAAFSSDATSVEITFSVYNASLDTSSEEVLTVPLVSGDNPGMMPAESYEALTQALADILVLQQQGGKYIGQSFATKAALNAYVFAGGDNPGDFTFVLDDETQNDATTRYIISGAKTPTDTRAWSFGYVINYDPTGLATALAAGLVKGTAATDGNEGKVFVETDGTMSVIGWDSLVAAVGTLSGLTTTAKGSLVAAINEVKASIPTIASTSRLLKGDSAGNATTIAATAGQLVKGDGTGYDMPASLPANGGNADTVAGKTPQQIIDSIQVGGRNLIFGTDVYVSSNTYMNYTKSELLKLRNKSIVISIDVELVNGYAIDGSFNRIGAEMAVKYTDGSEGYYNVFHGIYQGNNFKGRIFAVMTILDKEIEDIIYIFSIVQIGGDIKKVGRLKIELGNIATDWTPAPEDLVPEIFEGSTPPTSGFKDGDIFIKTS